MNATEPHKWEVKIGLGNGLVPSGKKPFSELMLQGYWNRRILCHTIRTQKGLISYQLPESGGGILKFPMNEIISDETNSQCSSTHKDHGPWVPGTHKEVLSNI